MADLHHLAQFRTGGSVDAVQGEAVIDTGRVIRSDAGEFLVVTSGTIALRAKKAAGCLLEPEEKDTVLVVRNTPTGAYIFSVLERGDTASRVILPGDATLSAKNGTLRLSGDKIEVAGHRAATMEAPEIKLQGVQGDVSFLNLSVSASNAEAKAARLSLVASVIDMVSERITQRVRDCFRRVARMDSTRAGQVSISAESRFDLKAGAASIVAECDVKIDGDKIRLG